jgi:two-component system nitrate/nitrite sensor histidine kinase NarX
MANHSEQNLVTSDENSWRSHLCAPIFTLGIIVILMGIISIWALRASGAGLPMYIFICILLLGALGLLALLLIRVRKTLLSPLTMLRDWVHNIRSGNLSARIIDDGHSEFSELVKDVNALGDKLQGLSDDMQSQVSKQTKHIERKTHSLEIIYDVAASINVSRDLDDLLTRFLHTLKDVVNARAAVVRLVTEDNQMRLVSSIGMDDDLMAKEQLIPSESCLCGSAYKNGKVLFQKDLNQCDKIIGRSFFEQDNIGMIVVPLQYRDKTLGVYNLFVDNSGFADPEDIEELLTSLGRHLGMAIDKARSEDEANRLSIMEERTRLAHELHDSLAQTLASLRFQVRVLDETIRKGEEPSIWHELEQIENNLDEAYAELRELITHFRAPIDKRGLIPAVEHLVERFRNQTDISIYLQKEWNVLHLPPSIEVQALRIIQEALNNIRKHSQAHTVRVILRSDIQGDCRILIEDDGIGINLPKQANKNNTASGEHIGLSIMDERAARIGGTVKIESEEGEGTRIILSFPHPGTIPVANDTGIKVEPPVKKILP